MTNLFPFRFDGEGYSAVATEDRVAVLLEGEEVVSLPVRTAIDRLSPRENDALSYDTVEDIDEGALTARMERDGDTPVLVYHTRSAAWAEKEYRFAFTPGTVTASVRVRGAGRVGEVRWFGGKSAADMLGGASYEFSEYFVPQSDFFSREHRVYQSIEPYHSYFEALCPPLYVYSFRTPGIAPRLGAGLVGNAGDWNFMNFDYCTRRTRTRTAFYLACDFAGHRAVDGAWQAPSLLLFPARDDMAAVRGYADRCRALGAACGIAKTEARPAPRWWHGPIVCGWREQAVFANGGEPAEQATEANYRDFMRRVLAAGLRPRIVIIDDKWQAQYGTARPDPAKWQNLRAFCDDMKKEGIHTLLWYKMWAGEGLPASECIAESDETPYGTAAYNEAPYCDPSSPQWQARLAETMRVLLGDGEGCMGADGLKLDFAFMMPRGRRARSQGGQYGTELLLLQMREIVKAAKAVKPDCLINCSPCHPLFAGIPDQCRLHDYDDAQRGYCEEMAFRRDLFDICFPGVSIDTDSPCYGSHRSTMRALAAQPSLGVPDLYRIAPDAGFAFTEEDLAALRTLWADYDRRVDAQYRV